MKRMLVPCLIPKALGFGLVYCFFIFPFDKKFQKKNRIIGFVLLKFERANSSLKEWKILTIKLVYLTKTNRFPWDKFVSK